PQALTLSLPKSLLTPLPSARDFSKTPQMLRHPRRFPRGTEGPTPTINHKERMRFVVPSSRVGTYNYRRQHATTPELSRPKAQVLARTLVRRVVHWSGAGGRIHSALDGAALSAIQPHAGARATNRSGRTALLRAAVG